MYIVYTWVGTEAVNDAGPSSQVRERELIELGPALWNEHAPLLHHRVEPGKGKQGLRPHHRMTPLHIVPTPRLVRSLEVSFDSRWSLVGDLETGLEEDGGELGVGLSGEPQPEPLVWL